MKFVYRDYWDGEHNPYKGIIHNPNDDCIQNTDLLDSLFPNGLKDGDEIEITITKTGNRPFGDRRRTKKKKRKTHIINIFIDKKKAQYFALTLTKRIRYEKAYYLNTYSNVYGYLLCCNKLCTN